MSIFELPRIPEAAFADLIKRELPGLEFSLRRDDSTYMTVLELRRRVEGGRVALTDVETMHDDEALSRTTLEAIDRLREQAMVDYGLRAILDREKVEAHREGFKAMVKNLEGYVDQNMREWIEVLDEDGKTKDVKGGPTWEGERILAWLKTLQTPDKH